MSMSTPESALLTITPRTCWVIQQLLLQNQLSYSVNCLTGTHVHVHAYFYLTLTCMYEHVATVNLS